VALTQGKNNDYIEKAISLPEKLLNIHSVADTRKFLQTNRKTKYILKETFKDTFHASLYNLPKAGFEVPISRWLKTDLKFLIDQCLAKTKLREQGIFDFEIVDGLIQNHLSNKTDTSWMLWNLIVFQYWYQNYFR
jgi:asparagine synthase (glutamine-hydrolysing)